MAVIKVVHDDGRLANMTTQRLAAVAADGWRPVEPGDLVGTALGTIRSVLEEVGNDPAKAAAALELELAGKNRPSLIEKLTAVTAASTADPATTSN